MGVDADDVNLTEQSVAEWIAIFGAGYVEEQISKGTRPTILLTLPSDADGILTAVLAVCGTSVHDGQFLPTELLQRISLAGIGDEIRFCAFGCVELVHLGAALARMP